MRARSRLRYRRVTPRYGTRPYNALLQHLESVGKQLIGTYRSANRLSRKTSAPNHFAGSWAPQWPTQITPDENDGKDRKATVKQLVDRLGTARRSFLSAYDGAVGEYLRIDYIVSKDALDRARSEVK